jgi:hypothetical protein
MKAPTSRIPESHVASISPVLTDAIEDFLESVEEAEVFCGVDEEEAHVWVESKICDNTLRD